MDTGANGDLRDLMGESLPVDAEFLNQMAQAVDTGFDAGSEAAVQGVHDRYIAVYTDATEPGAGVADDADDLAMPGIDKVSAA